MLEVDYSLYRFAYTLPYHKDRELLPFQLRDSDAAALLMTALRERNYRLKNLIINYPSQGPDLIPYDDSYLRDDDLVLLAGRPPMDDKQLGNKKSMARSYTTLEDKFFTSPLRELFTTCARPEVVLTDAAARISAEIARRQTTQYFQTRGAWYECRGTPGNWEHFKHSDRLTAAFLVYTEHAWPGGPAFLTAFGMGGTETLVWCYHLANRFPHLLCTTSFVMAEMRRGPAIERPTSLSFADSWEVTILGTAGLPRHSLTQAG